MRPSRWQWVSGTSCSGDTRVIPQPRARTRRCIFGFIACFNSASFCSRQAQFSVESGQIIPGADFGAGTRKRRALIALLCYILALHGRLAGWWTQFGLVVASVVCFLAVLMAWYGVNFVLGKGLHSYGFGIGGETYVAIFVALDLLFVAFAIWRCRRSASS